MEENKDIKEATVKVKEMSEDEKLERLAFLREKAIMDEKAIYRAGEKHGRESGIEEGIEIGIKQGVERGIEQEKKIIAKELKKMNMSVEEISKITGLVKEEIQKL